MSQMPNQPFHPIPPQARSPRRVVRHLGHYALRLTLLCIYGVLTLLALGVLAVVAAAIWSGVGLVLLVLLG